MFTLFTLLVYGIECLAKTIGGLHQKEKPILAVRTI
jgi:hypothetical protein